VVIADVSGKGIAAALLMAFVRPVMRSALLRAGDPVESLELMNWILAEERRTGLFVTILAGVLDLDTGIFSFANAGHEMPLLIPADGGEPRLIPGGGPLVGMFARLGLQEQRVVLQPGDALLLYTDGVTDARSPAGQRFGEARFVAAAQAAMHGPTAAPCRRVIDEVLGFQAGAEPADDIALLVLRRLGGHAPDQTRPTG